MNHAQAIDQSVINTFRETYHGLQNAVEASLNNEFGDSVVLERLLDDLQSFSGILEVHGGFLDPEEAATIVTNVALLVQEVCQAHRRALDSSHYGTHHPVTYIYTGRAGRPRAFIEPEWLAWAYQHRSTSGIARFLNLGRNTVREALIANGLTVQQEYPFEARHTHVLAEEEDEDVVTNAPLPHAERVDLPPQQPQPPPTFPQEMHTDQPDHEDENPPELEPIGSRQAVFTQVRSYTSPVSQWTDEELDNAITRLRMHYPNAGLTFLRGSLLAMGQRVPRERIRLSLLRIDPVRRIFERRTIQRRTYSVPGPNSLWHHDGQHGLIRWRIVFHGFIDGYSRLITGLRASNNNRASTVLEVFTEAITNYRVPSRVRGDHGTENIEVAAFMEEYRGLGRGSYIWGRSVHNVRIERLWVDLTVALGAKWAEFFELLEVQSGLDVNNINHIWLLHYLFLADINEEVSFFVRTWNHHPIQMRGQLNRSPIDMYGFDMLIQGIRGDTYNAQATQDLELYGVDWEALREGEIAESQLRNNSPTEGTSSWVGRSGPPDHLSEVTVDEPTCDLSAEDVHALYQFIHPLLELSDRDSLERRWTQALAFCQTRSASF